MAGPSGVSAASSRTTGTLGTPDSDAADGPRQGGNTPAQLGIFDSVRVEPAEAGTPLHVFSERESKGMEGWRR